MVLGCVCGRLSSLALNLGSFKSTFDFHRFIRTPRHVTFDCISNQVLESCEVSRQPVADVNMNEERNVDAVARLLPSALWSSVKAGAVTGKPRSASGHSRYSYN